MGFPPVEGLSKVRATTLSMIDLENRKKAPRDSSNKMDRLLSHLREKVVDLRH
jgi:hypothetical protein